MARPIEMETLLMATARNEMDRPSYQSVNDPWRSKRERAYLGGLNWATRTTGATKQKKVGEGGAIKQKG
jgi:hypothetical protein